MDRPGEVAEEGVEVVEAQEQVMAVSLLVEFHPKPIRAAEFRQTVAEKRQARNSGNLPAECLEWW